MGLKPLAVLISDVHFNINTLEIADKAMRMAINRANELDVPLVVAGDLHDTKAHMRGECINAMIETFKLCKSVPIVLVGNHDKINEKSIKNSLEFLQPYASIIKSPINNLIPKWTFIPYQHDVNELRKYLDQFKGTLNIIMHQGLTGSDSGEYIQDKSAITKEDVAGFRIISGHYHQRQTINLPDNGKWDYIGNPYSLNFGEVNDPEKGFQILHEDGSLEFVPTNLRKHLIIEHDLSTKESKWSSTPAYRTGDRNDLIWVKIKGDSEILSKFDKNTWCKEYGIPNNIRLDLIPNDTKTTLNDVNVKEHSQTELFDMTIDSLTNMDQERKNRLKTMWKELI